MIAHDALIVVAKIMTNRLRGAGGFRFLDNRFYALPGCRIIASLFWGLFSALQIQAATIGWFGIDILACGLLFLLWAMPGWGLYFAAFSGKWNPAETEIPIIDSIGLYIVPFRTADVDVSNYRRGALCMGLRGTLILPYYLYLGWRIDHMLLSAGLGMAAAYCMGLSYCYGQHVANWFGGRRDPVEAAEVLTGTAFAFLSVA